MSFTFRSLCPTLIENLENFRNHSDFYFIFLFHSFHGKRFEDRFVYHFHFWNLSTSCLSFVNKDSAIFSWTFSSFSFNFVFVRLGKKAAWYLSGVFTGQDDGDGSNSRVRIPSYSRCKCHIKKNRNIRLFAQRARVSILEFPTSFSIFLVSIVCCCPAW